MPVVFTSSEMLSLSIVVAPLPKSYTDLSPLPQAIAPKELVLYGLRLGVELLHIM